MKSETLKFLIELLSNPIDTQKAISEGFNEEFIQNSFALLKQVESQHRTLVKQLLHRLYLRFIPLRSSCRRIILEFLRQALTFINKKPQTTVVPFQHQSLGTSTSTIPPSMLAMMSKTNIPLPHSETTSLYLSNDSLSIYNGLSETLALLASIVSGCKQIPLHKDFIHDKGLLYCVISLHFNSTMIDELTSVLALYHKVLSFSIVKININDCCQVSFLLCHSIHCQTT